MPFSDISGFQSPTRGQFATLRLCGNNSANRILSYLGESIFSMLARKVAPKPCAGLEILDANNDG